MKKFLALVLAMMMLVSVFAGCAKTPANDGNNNQPNTNEPGDNNNGGDTEAPGPNQLLLPVPQNMADIFPPVWDNYGGVYRMMVFSRLLRLDTDLNPVYKDLAADFTESEDYLTYEFTLRDDVKWHDGEAFTAEDVEYTVKAALRYPETNNVIKSALAAIEGGADYRDKVSEEIPGLIVEGNKVTFKLSQTSSTFLMVMAQLNILPKHLLGDVDPLTMKTDKYWAKPIGTGPWMVDEFVPNDYALLKTFPDYFGAKPQIEEVKLSYITETDYVVRSQANEIDYFQTNDPATAAEVAKNPNYSVNPVDIYFVRYLMWNSYGPQQNGDDPLSDVRSRRAILHAIDRASIVEQLMPGAATVIDTKVPPNFTDWYNPDTYKYDYNPDKAKQLLEEANFDFSKKIRIACYYGDQLSADLMDLIVDYLSKVGIQAEWFLITGDITTQLYDVADYNLLYAGLSAMAPEEAYNVFSSTFIANSSYAKVLPTTPNEMDPLIEQLGLAADPAKKADILKQLQAMEDDMLYQMMLFAPKNFIIYNKARLEIPQIFSNDWSNYERKMEEWVIKAKG